MHNRLRRICLIALIAFLSVVNASWAQSTIEGTLQLEDGTPSLIHVKRIDYPALQLGTWQEEILVNEAGGFQWNAPGEGLYELVAPPWSWMVWVRPDEPAGLHLSGGNSTARRLLGSPGRSTWTGDHPTQWMDSLVGLQLRANRLRAEALVLRSSGIDIQQRDSLAQLNAELAAAFESQWTRAVNGCTSEWECDLAWQIKLNEAAGSGRSQIVLDSLWTMSSMGDPNRTWASRLASPGAYSGWLAVHGGWWLESQVDWEKLNEAVFTANMDSLASAMGGRWKTVDRAEMAAAWLDKAMDQPDALVRSVWETFPFPESFVTAYDALREYRKIGRSGHAVGDLSWTLPNGDLSSIAEQCQQPWTAGTCVGWCFPWMKTRRIGGKPSQAAAPWMKPSVGSATILGSWNPSVWPLCRKSLYWTKTEKLPVATCRCRVKDCSAGCSPRCRGSKQHLVLRSNCCGPVHEREDARVSPGTHMVGCWCR